MWRFCGVRTHSGSVVCDGGRPPACFPAVVLPCGSVCFRALSLCMQPHSPKAVGRRGHVRDAGGNVGVFGGCQPDARAGRAGAGRREAYVERSQGNGGGARRGMCRLDGTRGEQHGASGLWYDSGDANRRALPWPRVPVCLFCAAGPFARVRWRRQWPSNGVLLHRRPSRPQPKRSRARLAAHRRGLSCCVAPPLPLSPSRLLGFHGALFVFFCGIFAQVLSSPMALLDAAFMAPSRAVLGEKSPLTSVWRARVPIRP